jgi:hypothetical protein
MIKAYFGLKFLLPNIFTMSSFWIQSLRPQILDYGKIFLNVCFLFKRVLLRWSPLVWIWRRSGKNPEFLILKVLNLPLISLSLSLTTWMFMSSSLTPLEVGIPHLYNFSLMPSQHLRSLISTFLKPPLLIDELGSLPHLADSRLNQPMKWLIHYPDPPSPPCALRIGSCCGVLISSFDLSIFCGN